MNIHSIERDVSSVAGKWITSLLLLDTLSFILLFIYQGEHSCVTFCYPRRQAWRQWFHCSISSCSVSAQQNMTEQMNQLSVPVAVPSQGEAKEVRRPD